MAENLPTNFQIPAESSIASYDAQDIASGTGHVTYYAGTLSGSSILSENVFYSGDQYTDGGLLTASYVKEIDKDFDVQFTRPQILQGDAIIDVPVVFYHDGNSATPTADVYVSARIRKWDGATETEIAEGSSPVWTAGVAGVGTWNWNIRTAHMTVPRTHFKIGEYLRLTVEVWAKEGEAANNRVIIGHDPADRGSVPIDGQTYSTVFISGSSQLKAQIPFRIDL